MGRERGALFGLESFGLSEGEHGRILLDFNGFRFGVDGRGTVKLGEFFARLAPVALAGATAVAIVAAAGGIAAVEVASRALAAFATFATTGASSGAGVTFMIASTALGVESLSAFGADDFAFEFANSLRCLLLVRFWRGSCDFERSKRLVSLRSSPTVAQDLDWG